MKEYKITIYKLNERIIGERIENKYGGGWGKLIEMK